MKVTNQQAEAHVVCFESMDKCPDDCPFVGSSDCSEDKAFEVDIAKDLLEARAQSDKLLAALKNIIEGNDLAHERNQDMRDWPKSDFRRQARAAIAECEADK